MLNLVRYECGCIGFKPDAKGLATILNSCDSDSCDEFYIYDRDMIKSKGQIKEFEVLSEEQSENIRKSLCKVIMDGYKFRKIKSLLS